MSKINTMKIPLGNGAYSVVGGERIRLQVGDVWIMFFINKEGDTLSHWASGYKVGSLNAIKLNHMVATGYNTLTNRQAAKRLIAELVSQHGVAGLIARFDAVPCLNAETKKGCGIGTKPKP